jgi:lysophospholipase L1-like esterase
MYSGVTNSEIDAVNIEFDKDFGNRTGFVIIDAKSALAPTGQLDPANTIDGLHLSATGYAKLYPLIQSAISSLGINVGM